RIPLAVAALLAAGTLIVSASLAASGEPEPAAIPADAPAAVATHDAGARRPGGPAEHLMARGASAGQLSVIVGFRCAMRGERASAPSAQAAEKRALRTMQDGVIGRVYGMAKPEDADLYSFIPFMALVIDRAEAERLLADPNVVSIEEDTGGSVD